MMLPEEQAELINIIKWSSNDVPLTAASFVQQNKNNLPMEVQAQLLSDTYVSLDPLGKDSFDVHIYL